MKEMFFLVRQCMRQKDGVSVADRHQAAMGAGNSPSLGQGVEVGTEAIDLKRTTAQLVWATTGGSRHDISLAGVMSTYYFGER